MDGARWLPRGRCYVKSGSKTAALHVELQAAEEFVELVGGVEIGFEFAGVEALAEVVEAAREKIQSRGEHFFIGQNDIAPC